jgi:hypothetical protein
VLLCGRCLAWTCLVFRAQAQAIELYLRLLERGLASEESVQHQYRFKEIVDIETREPLYTIEHEVRSMRHPLFMRPLVNRNPEQNNMRYAYGYNSTGAYRTRAEIR